MLLYGIVGRFGDTRMSKKKKKMCHHRIYNILLYILSADGI